MPLELEFMRIAAFAICALSLSAADPWQTKPFAEWTEKDARKLLANSPWARPVQVALGSALPDAQVKAGPAPDPNRDAIGPMTAQGAIPDAGRGSATEWMVRRWI